MGGLVIDSYEAAMKGGDHGPMVVPGKAEASLMVKMLEGKVQPLMPFGADPLPPATIALVKAWIDTGAKGAGTTVAAPPLPANVADAAPAVSVSSASNPTTPYARIDRAAIAYVGPDRSTDRDLAGPEIRVGLMAPLEGPRKAEGEAMVLAARLALEDHGGSLPDGQRASLAVGDESGPWGHASSEVVRLVSDESAVAVITSADGGVTHLAEQIGNKIGVAIVTLSSDSTTTQIDLPWIFRLAAADRLEAQTLAQEIYMRRHFSKVLLIAERDHDGRAGELEFKRAVADLGVPAPHPVELDPGAVDLPELVATLQSERPEAVVLWTDNPLARASLAALEQSDHPPIIFLCQKAAAAELNSSRGGTAWTVFRTGADPTAQAGFAERFLFRSGGSATPEAAATYDAVSLVLAALRQAGPNRARVRDQLARTSHFAGVSGGIAFDGAGNNLAPIDIVAVSLSARGMSPAPTQARR